MTLFNLFDSVKLKEALARSEDGTLPAGTPGAIVEIFNQGEAYLVEFFGNWVKLDPQEQFTSAAPQEEGAFVQTLSIETVKPEQLDLVASSRETVGARVQILSLLDELSDRDLDEVRDFAEFLRSRQNQTG